MSFVKGRTSYAGHRNTTQVSRLANPKFLYAVLTPRVQDILLLILQSSGFGGLEVACWPLVPKFTGSNPAEAVGFLRVNKNPQHVGAHGCLSVVIVVCCQVVVSATN